jgi:biopolymer transport protein ExbD
MKRHRQPLEINAQLNVTNLVDTTFILLITFMLLAPQLQLGIRLKLPEVKESPTLDIDANKTFVISIQKKDPAEQTERIYLQTDRVTLDELAKRIQEERGRRPDLAVVIETDEDSRSGVFIQVIGAVKNAGVESIGLSTLPGPSETAPKPKI